MAEKFEVSWSPVREALLALEKEGTLAISPYRGAIVKPLSGEEILDIAELRLALISLALKPAHRHLSPADFGLAYDLAKRLTRINNARDHFEYNRQFWDGLFSKAQRPILLEVFRQLEDRMTRYWPLLLKLFPPETRPRHQEVLIEIYRKGKIAEAFRAYKKIYLEAIDQVIDHLGRKLAIPLGEFFEDGTPFLARGNTRAFDFCQLASMNLKPKRGSKLRQKRSSWRTRRNEDSRLGSSAPKAF